MPLNTQIERDGELLSVKWGGFHVAAMVLAVMMDTSDKDSSDLATEDSPLVVTQSDVWRLMSYPAIASTELNKGEYVLTQAYKFEDEEDGEILELQPGDILRVWRS